MVYICRYKCYSKYNKDDDYSFAQLFKMPDTPTAVVGNLGVICNNADELAVVVDWLKAANVQAVPTEDMADTVVMSGDIGGLLVRYKMDIQTALQMGMLSLREKKVARFDAEKEKILL